METLQTVITQILANLSSLGFAINTSVTSIYTTIANAIGLVIYNTQQEIANSESIITNLLISQQGYGKSAYYTGIALQFQYGYNLSINTAINPVTGAPYENLIYTTIDTTAKIIAQAAIQATPQGGSTVLFLKVATTAISGTGLMALSPAQLAAFSSYMLSFEIIDSPINIISLDGNVLDFTSTCTYLSSYDLSTLQTNIQTALNNFQTQFQLNGTFFDGDLEQYIQTNVPGVRNFFINNTTLDGNSFSDYTLLSSGYFNYFSNLLNQITYNPTNQ